MAEPARSAEQLGIAGGLSTQGRRKRGASHGTAQPNTPPLTTRKLLRSSTVELVDSTLGGAGTPKSATGAQSKSTKKSPPSKKLAASKRAAKKSESSESESAASVSRAAGKKAKKPAANQSLLAKKKKKEEVSPVQSQSEDLEVNRKGRITRRGSNTSSATSLTSSPAAKLRKTEPAKPSSAAAKSAKFKSPTPKSKPAKSSSSTKSSKSPAKTSASAAKAKVTASGKATAKSEPSTSKGGPSAAKSGPSSKASSSGVQGRSKKAAETVTSTEGKTRRKRPYVSSTGPARRSATSKIENATSTSSPPAEESAVRSAGRPDRRVESYRSPIPAKKARVSSSTVALTQGQSHGQGTSSGSSLRRSSRCKLTTGSCASTSRRSSRGGGVSSGGAAGAQAGQQGSSGNSVHSSSAAAAAAVGAATLYAAGMSAEDDKAMLAQGSSSTGPSSNSTGGAPAAGTGASSSLLAGAPSASSSSGAPGSHGTGATGLDSESEDSEVGRLQALLEARGLPPHLFGALGPRVQHLLHRSMGASSTATKAQQLLVSLQATGDEDQQLQAVVEMCQMLVMGNEDTLTGFPVKQVVPALITLLSMDHNFDMMNNACRALTYMMEALPRSSAVVLDAVPAFLEKLQVIQCMDVAEQSLTALEMLSRRHSKAILQARGVSSCLTYIDFFSIVAQRAALAVTANCCNNLHPDEFAFVSPSLPNLAKRLTQQDKKSVESICSVFCRLVDSFQTDPAKLREIASDELLSNIQQLLVVSPPLISSGTFITVLRMLSTMCVNCSDLALTLLKLNIADTLCYLLTSSPTNKSQMELIQRSPQELYEITCLIGELMPRLPTDGLFAVDSLLMLERSSGGLSSNSLLLTDQGGISWQWKDDRSVWHPYSSGDSRRIESAHQAGEDEISLTTLGREYTLDFHAMQQINELTGTQRPVSRRQVPNVNPPCQDASLDMSNNNRCVLSSSNGSILAASFIRSLFSVLYEVYSSSAGPAVRCKCLRALLRMIYYAPPELLQEVLKNQVVSSHIAGMMASQDLRIVVGALQMAEILMQKLPHVFEVHFTREGVMHQIKQLTDPSVSLGASPPKQHPPSAPSSSAGLDTAPGPGPSSFHVSLATSFSADNPVNLRSPTDLRMPTAFNSATSGGSNHTEDNNLNTAVAASKVSSPQIRLSDVLKRKRTSKGRSSSSRKSKQTESSSSVSTTQPSSSSSGPSMAELFSGSVAGSSSSSSTSHAMGTRSTRSSKFAGATTNFLASLNPARWGRSNERAYHKESAALAKCPSSSNLSAGNKEKARVWVRDRAVQFLKQYDSDCNSYSGVNILSRLTSTIHKLDNESEDSLTALADLRDIVLTSDISPFEVNHSGLVKSLLGYLTRPGEDRQERIRQFLHVFAKCPLMSNMLVEHKDCSAEPMAALIAKLNGCVSQLEQLPVKVHDLPAGTGSTTALKFFNTHQLKCHLQRHPSCTSLKQWKGGTVKIDPLALVQAIERYLVVRGYARIRDKDSGESDEDNSDEDIDDTLAAVVISHGARHKLQFLIGDTPLPYNMTVYQAIRQFSPAAQTPGEHAGANGCETESESEAPLGSASVWVQSHTIYYRPVLEETEKTTSNSNVASTSNSNNASTSASTQANAATKKGKTSSGKSSSKRKGDEIWSDGLVPLTRSPLDPYLSDTLPPSVTIQDACLPVLTLLRVLNAINRNWGSLYIPVHNPPLLSPSTFINSKICAKASRQLQDPLVIMTGNLPHWLHQLATTCPFLLNFEIRQLLLYASSFDRDRALQRLVDSAPEINNHSDTQERVTPRLDRRKRTVSRQDILKQAESLLSDLAHSKALLEIQYENEVGTGLGPTLEFYALVSKELQKTELELWHNGSGDTTATHVYSAHGVYPCPVAKNTKLSHLVKLKSKFRFLGKFMAKAVMDSRMLDLPLCVTFYKWLLGEESYLNLSDLVCIAPDVYRTLARFQSTLVEKSNIELSSDLTAEEKEEGISALSLDGCVIEELGLDFTLPGHAHVELRKDGRDIPVTIHNLAQYCKLVVHWYLNEGVARQMESFREGFECVFPLAQLSMFYPEELEYVFCGSGSSSWDMKTLMECCRIDHGYNANSKAIKYLFHVLSCYSDVEQRDFLQFVTGSPRLPVGGFRALSPPLTIVRKTFESELAADGFLPSVMTCVNYLKLPDYSSVDVMRSKLRLAAQEGQHSFHLS